MFLMISFSSNAQQKQIKSNGMLELGNGKIVFCHTDFLYLEEEIRNLYEECGSR